MTLLHWFAKTWSLLKWGNSGCLYSLWHVGIFENVEWKFYRFSRSSEGLETHSANNWELSIQAEKAEKTNNTFFSPTAASRTQTLGGPESLPAPGSDISNVSHFVHRSPRNTDILRLLRGQWKLLIRSEVSAFHCEWWFYTNKTNKQRKEEPALSCWMDVGPTQDFHPGGRWMRPVWASTGGYFFFGFVI